MTNPWAVFAITVFLIAMTAFFVIIEFSLLAARRSRLEEDAATSRAARSALRGMNELTIMLAGAQLGITAATFALGAVTKPALQYALAPVFQLWGMPLWTADILAFAIALLIVTFLHLVVGEMAPKSWAIAHPETSAKLIGLPARAFVWFFRPFLIWVNAIANRLVAATGVSPVERAAVGGHDAATIRHLVEHSAIVGTLDASFVPQISGALELEVLRVDELLTHDSAPVAVPRDATAADVQAMAARSGHMRILVGADGDGVPGVVHVRDTLLEPGRRPARELAREAFALETGTPLYEALARMREDSEQLAVVMRGEEFLGVITLADVLRRVLPGPADAAVTARG